MNTLRLIAHTYRKDPRDFWTLSVLMIVLGSPLYTAIAAITPN